MGATVMHDKRQAMPALIIQEFDELTLIMWAQTGDEETKSLVFAQTESEISTFVSEACTQTEQLSFSENYTPNVSQIENENETSIEKYMRTISTTALELKMSELTVYDIEKMKERVLMHWDTANQNWINGTSKGWNNFG